MDDIVCGRCSVSEIIKFRFFFRHLKLEIALAIPASNEIKRKNNEIFLSILEKIANGFNFCQFESHKRAIVFSTTI